MSKSNSRYACSSVFIPTTSISVVCPDDVSVSVVIVVLSTACEVHYRQVKSCFSFRACVAVLVASGFSIESIIHHALSPSTISISINRPAGFEKSYSPCALDFDDLTGDHQTLNISSPFIHMTDAYIPINTFYGEIRHIAISAMNLNGIRADPLCNRRSKQFGHRGFFQAC